MAGGPFALLEPISRRSPLKLRPSGWPTWRPCGWVSSARPTPTA